MLELVEHIGAKIHAPVLPQHTVHRHALLYQEHVEVLLLYKMILRNDPLNYTYNTLYNIYKTKNRSKSWSRSLGVRI